MTLELNQVAPQVKELGRSLAEQSPLRDEAGQTARALLQQFSTQYTALNQRIALAEKVQQKLRFDWVGAAPTLEALSQAHPLPPCPARLTVIASDGSQILPSRHAITLYYLVNVGSIVYRHGSNQKPETYHPKPLLYYAPEDILDEQGRLISPGEVKGILSELGFQNIVITHKEQSEEIIREWHVAEGAEKVVFSAYVQAVKPLQP